MRPSLPRRCEREPWSEVHRTEGPVQVRVVDWSHGRLRPLVKKGEIESLLLSIVDDARSVRVHGTCPRDI